MLGNKLTGLKLLLTVHTLPDLPILDIINGYILSFGNMLNYHLLDLFP